MRKLIILVVIALVIEVSASPYSVLATETSNMTYSDGVVTYSGSGFVPNTEYNIRIVNPSPQYLISMINAQSDSNGNIKPVNINVGILGRVL